MKDYIVFTVGSNYYALDVSCIERIIQIPSITIIPNSHPCIDGMISYENRVVKVVNFRKMTGMGSYEEEMSGFFTEEKNNLAQWVKALFEAVELENDFHLSTDSHSSKLGEWLNRYNSHDTEILAILKRLRSLHSKLYEIAREALALKESDSKGSLELIRHHVNLIFPAIAGELENMVEKSQSISQHLQKLLIYHENENYFAIKVDTIQDIVVIQSSMLKEVERSTKLLSFTETSGVVEIGERLVNVIKSVILPTRGGV
ncbi:MAG: chemotaxis protein CheW [Sulfuricurvum sp.]|uniref:chemotaxis protein CheW n=1 Tax=Sulfuricurvum sp. TaxID=2025608 RepID=UPI0025CF0A76|nr:chemotaxis protein CheW [Sulfuricurvum sp.]MBV5320426.1 chemotaxis protein CheW [Sulfuricurvum sp.]